MPSLQEERDESGCMFSEHCSDWSSQRAVRKASRGKRL